MDTMSSKPEAKHREQQSERTATSACPTDHSLKHQLQYEHLIETRKQIEIKKQKEFKL